MPDEISDLKARLAAAEAERDRLAMTPALDAAIAGAGVKPQLRAAVRALFLGGGKLELDGRDVLLAGIPIDTALKAWIASSEGVNFVGTDPVQKSGKGAPVKKRSEMTAAEKAAYTREHGLAAYEALQR